MFYIIAYCFVLLIYICCPLLAKLVILGLNFFIPDPLPAIDEIIMVIGLFSKLETLVEHFWKIVAILVIVIGIIIIF